MTEIYSQTDNSNNITESAVIIDTNTASINAILELANNKPEVELPLGNSIARTLNGELAYTRADETGNVNLSGVSETLLADEIAITKDGASIYGSYINDALWSEDFSHPAWLKLGADPTLITQDGTLSSDGINQAWKVENAIAGANRLQQNFNTALTGETRIACVEVKQGDTSSVRIVTGISTELETSVFDFNTGLFTINNNNGAKAYFMGNGWWRIFQPTTASIDGIYVMQIQVDIADAGYVYASRAMRIIDGKYNAPYIKATTTTALTRGADVASIQAMNNLPAQGQSFTIQAVCNMFNADDFGASIVIRKDALAATLALVRSASGAVYAVMTTSDGVFTTATTYFAEDKQVRYLLRYDGDNLDIIADGVVVITKAITGTPVYTFDSDIFIGTNGAGLSINSEIKEVEIYHTALSDEAAAAKGAA